MQVELDINGRRRRVDVSGSGDLLTVTVDGQVFQVDARRVGAHGLSLVIEGEDGGRRSVDTTVTPERRGGYAVALDGQTVSAVPVSRFGRRGGDAASGGGGPQQVTAPMPGKVVRVLVSPGDAVVPKQGLVVVEAMKMENELKATRAGTVKAVRAVEGQSVEAGALLVTVE